MTNLAKIMLIALTLGTLGIYLTSCNKSDSILEGVVENNIQQVVQAPTTENGWLHFADETAMETAFIELIEDYDALQEWETRYNHHSLRSRYVDLINTINTMEDAGESTEKLIKNSKDVIKIKGEGDEATIVCIVDDMMLSAFLNEDGIIQIGDKISKYSQDKLRVINDGDITKLEGIDKIQSSNDKLNIDVMSLNSDEKGIRCWRSFDELEHAETRDHGSSRRNLHSVRLYRTPNSHSIYMVTGSQSQRKSWGKWRDYRFDYSLRVNSDYQTIDMDAFGAGFPEQFFLISQGNFGTGNNFISENSNGRVSGTRWLGEMGTLGDINVFFNTDFTLRRSEDNDYSFSNQIWNIECHSVWYPWND